MKPGPCCGMIQRVYIALRQDTSMGSKEGWHALAIRKAEHSNSNLQSKMALLGTGRTVTLAYNIHGSLVTALCTTAYKSKLYFWCPKKRIHFSTCSRVYTVDQLIDVDVLGAAYKIVHYDCGRV
jgi:hypothetical protein